ncbi:helix-turn-helix domain-containing protein [Halomicroarcula sp. GCM10025709]|uniref:helix-turn-helix domain-containing protein n=1 Tax=Haloarcula TaxID=2237 RepID=UPI0024C24DCC|nr:helix-turn-helix domain-containing protein [Halomicroarcula sp. YJ-61-S]
MTVVADVSVPVGAVALGRVLAAGTGPPVVLERVVPIAETQVPLVWIERRHRSRAIETLEAHSTVDEIVEVCSDGDRSLYAIDWEPSADGLFAAVRAADGECLDGRLSGSDWLFHIAFPDHDALTAFEDASEDASVAVELLCVYNPTRPGTGAHYGLTPRQRETLIKAVTEGYYAIPREYSTKELGDSLDISDQAVTERLRRAIITLVENTLIASRGSDTQRLWSSE